MPYQEIQALGFPNSPRKLGLYEKPWACISWHGPCTQLVNSKYGLAISQSDCRKADQYQLPCNNALVVTLANGP